MSSLVHIDNKKRNLIFDKGPTDGLHDAKLTPEKKYLINFIEQQKKFCWVLNGADSYMFVNSAEIYKFKAKDSEINAAPLMFEDIFQFIIWKRQDYMDTAMIFQLIMKVLILMIF